MNKAMKTAAVAGLLAATMFGSAYASPLSVTNESISIYNTSVGAPGNGSAALEQALPGGGSLYNSPYLLATINYTGLINFNDPAAGADTVGGFLADGTGTYTPTLTTAQYNTKLSGGNFTNTTGLAFTFTTTYTETLDISHDDGVSLYSGGVNVLPISASSPTTLVDATATIGPGTYTLYYIEANGLPADLIVDVPEPASLAILGAGLAGLGFIRRRRGQKAA